MRRNIIGGLLAVVLLAGCGAVEHGEEYEEAQALDQQGQALVACPAGYDEYPTWVCQPRGCGTLTADILYLFCCNASGCFNAGEMDRTCGLPCN